MKILDLSGQTTILRAGFLLVYALGHLHLGVPFKQFLMIRDHDLSKYPKMVFPVKHGAYRSHYDVIDSPICCSCFVWVQCTQLPVTEKALADVVVLLDPKSREGYLSPLSPLVNTHDS